MAADNDHARTLRQQRPDLVDDADELGTRFGRADREHAEVRIVGQADQQAFLDLTHFRAGPAPALMSDNASVIADWSCLTVAAPGGVARFGRPSQLSADELGAAALA
jgi:hypothetical protein